MTLPPNMVEKLSAESRAIIEDFLKLCRELNGVVKMENESILSAGNAITLSDAEFHTKLDLMGVFLARSTHIFEIIKDQAPENKWLYLYIVNEISGLRNSFKINTALYMDGLQRHSKRLALMQDGILAAAASQEEDNPSCH